MPKFNFETYFSAICLKLQVFTEGRVILSRYIFRETLKTQLAVLGILLMIFLSQSFIRFLARAARGAVPNQLVSELLLLNVPYMTMLMLPLSLFIAILFAHGRLYAESEMTVMRAVGIGPGWIMRSALSLALLSTLVAAVNTLWLTPWAERRQVEVLEEAKADPGLFALDSGRFINLDDGKVVAYIEAMDGKANRQLSRLYVLQQGDAKQGPSVVISDRGELNHDAQGIQWLTLRDGKRYEGPNAQGEFKISEYQTWQARMEEREATPTRRKVSTWSVGELLNPKPADKAKAQAEWQWRMAMPLSIPVLILIVVPMAMVNPRQGRYAKLLPAILIYLSYFLLLSAARSAMERGSLGALPGLYAVPLAFLLLFALPFNLSGTRWANRLRLRWKGGKA